MKIFAFLVRSLAYVVIAVSAVRPAAAQTARADAVRLDDIAREAARTFATTRADTDQTRPTTAPPPPGTNVDLTLDEATTRALERNLDIAVERLNPQTFDFSIAALDASYLPTFTSNVGLRSQSQFPRSQTAGADMLVTETFTGNSGIAQNVKWGGGSFAVTFNNNRQKQTDLFATRNPVLNANLNAIYIQPLLRGFRIDGTRSQLQVTHLNSGDVGNRLAGHHRSYIGERPERILGLGVRDRSGRRRGPLALAGDQARRRQSRARRGRCDGATRRCPGASGGGDAPTGADAGQTRIDGRPNWR